MVSELCNQVWSDHCDWTLYNAKTWLPNMYNCNLKICKHLFWFYVEYLSFNDSFIFLNIIPHIYYQHHWWEKVTYKDCRRVLFEVLWWSIISLNFVRFKDVEHLYINYPLFNKITFFKNNCTKWWWNNRILHF